MQFLDMQLDATPDLVAATSSYTVLGRAEHVFDWQPLEVADLLRLLKIVASPDEVNIIRHSTGFVILKKPA